MASNTYETVRFSTAQQFVVIVDVPLFSRQVTLYGIHLQRLLCIYCLGHAGVKVNDQADRLAAKATITSGLFQKISGTE